MKIFIPALLVAAVANSHAGGSIDHISFDGLNVSVAGWACDPTNPNPAAQIQVIVSSSVNGSQMIWQGLANLPREQAVATACGSSNSNHGFNQVINASSVLDNVAYDVEVKVLYSNTGQENLDTSANRRYFFKNASLVLPNSTGDIVGRDLDVSLAGTAGHIGIYSAGMVWEMLNESKASQYNTWDNFTLKTKVWNSNNNKIPNGGIVKTCFKPEFCLSSSGAVLGGTNSQPTTPNNSDTVSRRDAAVWRAYQIWASPTTTYTKSWTYTPFVPLMRHPVTNVVIRNATAGRYRCDSFVVDVLAWTTHWNGAPQNDIWNSTIPYNIEITPHHQAWSNSFSQIASRNAIVTPKTIVNKLNSQPSY
jgi:hypothetical protein